MQTKFPYRSLDSSTDEVRLLILHPASEHDPLECSLMEAPLSKLPPYIALSYAWGEKDTSASLQLNGVCIAIQKSLCEALQHLRSMDSLVVLWADALCINQDDKIEKSSQIQLMRLIYKTAVQVRVWLGPAADDSEYAMAYMAWQSSKGEERRSIIRKCQRATTKLLHRSWWERIWVIQEVAVAKQILLQCGRMMIDWIDFDKNVEALEKFNRDKTVFKTEERNEFTDRFNAHSELLLCREHVQDTAYLPLLTLLLNFRECRSTENKDKVYALLGLASDCHTLHIIPDYSKSFQDVYTLTAKQIMRQTKTLKLMIAAGTIYDTSGQPHVCRSKGLPFWVPDWSVCTTGDNVPKLLDPRLSDKRIMIAESDKVYAAGGSTEIDICFIENDSILRIGVVMLCPLVSTEMLDRIMTKS